MDLLDPLSLPVSIVHRSQEVFLAISYIGTELLYIRSSWSSYLCRGCPRGVMVKAMDCGIVVREFVLQSRYFVHFRANTLRKGMNPPYPPSYGLNSTTTVLLGE